MPHDAPRPIVPPFVERSWRVTLGFVVVSLLLLAVGPIVSSARVREHRDLLVDVIDPARVRVGEVQAAFSMQLFALGQIAQGDPAAGSATYQAAVARELAAEEHLDSLVVRLGPEVGVAFNEFRLQSMQWHLRVNPIVRQAAGEAATPLDSLAAQRVEARADVLEDLARDAAAALDAAARFDSLLVRRAGAQRAQIERVERLELLLPAVLVPLAVASALVVVWALRRIVALADEAERSRRALVATAAARAALVRGVTHDLKNPLGAALGYADLMLEGLTGPLTDDQRGTLGRLRGLIDRTLVTIRDVVDLSDTTAADLRLSLVPTDVAALAADLTADYAAAARAAGLTLRAAEVPNPGPVAVTDPMRVRQALGNLVSNAIKYTPAGGTVALSVVETRAERDGRHRRRPGVAIRVRDTGPGIPRELRERVFEEFYRIPDERSAVQGTGIGLAISRRMARLLGGDLTVDDAPGGGAEFTLWLPRDGPPAAHVPERRRETRAR